MGKLKNEVEMTKTTKKPKVKKSKKPKKVKVNGCSTLTGIGSRFLQDDARFTGSLDKELSGKKKRRSRL